jgi:hypothetical protein
MESFMIQSSAIVLAALITATATIVASRIKEKAQQRTNENDSSAANDTSSSAPTQKQTSRRDRQHMPRTPFFLGPVFVAIGQLALFSISLSTPDAPLTNFSAAITGQALVMLAIGFWLSLRD